MRNGAGIRPLSSSGASSYAWRPLGGFARGDAISEIARDLRAM